MNYNDEKLEKLVNGQFFLVANLPYYITTPIIEKIIASNLLYKNSVDKTNILFWQKYFV